MKALAALNDQVCFYFFLDAQAWPQIESVIAAQPDGYTTQAFRQNHRSQQIHVSLDRLAEFRAAQTQTTCAITFAFAVEKLLAFVGELADLWSSANEVMESLEEPVEQSFAEIFFARSAMAIETKLINTIKYFRLRRNHVVHMRHDHTEEMSAFLRQSSTLLQRVWAKQTDMDGLDFGKREVNHFDREELITAIKLMRIVVEELDACVARYVRVQWAINKIDRSLLAKLPTLRIDNPRIVERRVRKVKAMSNGLYGIEGTVDEFRDVIGVQA